MKFHLTTWLFPGMDSLRSRKLVADEMNGGLTRSSKFSLVENIVNIVKI